MIAYMNKAVADFPGLLMRHPKTVAALVFLFFTLLITSPGWLNGRIFVGSTDNYYHQIPNLMFTVKSLKAGDIGLWNPYIQTGIDFSSSTHNMIYSPFNWLLFLFPASWYLYLQTVRVFLEIWAVGFFAFLFFREEIRNDKWALFGAVTYQLCGFLYLSLTTYPCVQLFFLMPACGYLIWTMEKRSALLNYLLFVLCFSLIILDGNIIYEFGSLLVVAICFLYRWWPNSVALWRPIAPTLTFYSAAITALLLTAVRWVPISLSIMFDGARFEANGLIQSIPGRVHTLAMAAFPESFGIVPTDSRPFFRALWPSDGGHAQFHGFTYFGVVGLCLILLALIGRPKRAIFWLVWLLIAACWSLQVAPVTTILDAVFFPFVHTIIPKMSLPIAAAMAIGYMGMHLEQSSRRLPAGAIIILAAAPILFVAIAIIPRIVLAPGLLWPLRGLLLAIIGCMVLSYVMVMYRPERYALYVMAVAGLAGTALLILIYDLLPSPMMFSALYYIGLAVLAGLAVFAAQKAGALGPAYTGLILLALTVAILAGPFPVSMPWPDPSSLIKLAAGGMVRYIIFALIIMGSIAALRAGRLASGNVFLLLMALTVVDLVPYNINYSRQITEAFWKLDRLFPDRNSIIRPQSSSQTEALPNLLKNPSMEQWSSGGGVADWVLGGREMTAARIPSPVSGEYAVQLKSVNGGNLYQDRPAPDRTVLVSFGVWARSDGPGLPQILLTDGTTGRGSPPYSGNGRWQWLEASLKVEPTARYIRPHLYVPANGTVEYDGAKLAFGPKLLPFGYDKDHDDPLKQGFDGEWMQPLDPELVNYRVNYPHIFLQLSGSELQSNIPSVYGLRSYGGLNSDVPALLGEIIRRLEPENFNAAGFYSQAASPVLNDLVGNGYDPNYRQGREIRPTALSRFMFFSNFEVYQNGNQVLDRIAAPDFVARNGLLLMGYRPDFPASPGRGGKVEYEEKRHHELTMTIEAPQAGMLFFGDGYNRGWRAFVNGQEVPVVRANHAFMAIPVPAGRHEVEWLFTPPYFKMGLRITLVGFLLLILTVAGLFFFIRPKKGVAVSIG
ncbi:YfhO family protein [Ferrovibrio terrae]|nr:YfhO family protein [Ferrovibrio terrae]